MITELMEPLIVPGICGLCGLVVWGFKTSRSEQLACFDKLGDDLRKSIEKINEKIDNLRVDHRECERTLPYKFADRGKVESNFDKVYEKLEKHTIKIAKIEK